MVFVCNLRSIQSLANAVILLAIKTCQPCPYIKPIARDYTRECHENENTRFWATYVFTRQISHAHYSSLNQVRTLNTLERGWK